MHRVTAITTVDRDGSPRGFARQSFAALSLDPPLVLFCPSQSSATWPRVARARHFLRERADHQAAGPRQDVRHAGRGQVRRCGLVALVARGAGPGGVLTWVGCVVEAVHGAGDHHVVLGWLVELGPCRAEQPLLFYRYGVPDAVSADAPPEVVDTLLAWPRHADWI